MEIIQIKSIGIYTKFYNKTQKQSKKAETYKDSKLFLQPNLRTDLLERLKNAPLLMYLK